jgi:hypothetical protein
MSAEKLASQVAHAVIGLGITDPGCTIIVLGVSDKKFFEIKEQEECYVHADLGYTEVNPGTETCLAWTNDKPVTKLVYVADDFSEFDTLEEYNEHQERIADMKSLIDDDFIRFHHKMTTKKT